MSLLQQDARLSVAELGRRVRRSEAAVRDRIHSLEQHHVLTGYHADVDTSKVDLGVMALVSADMDPRDADKFRRALSGIPNVITAKIVTGDRPLRIRVVAKDMDDLESIIRECIAPLDLNALRTEVVIDTLVPQRPPPVLNGASDG